MSVHAILSHVNYDNTLLCGIIMLTDSTGAAAISSVKYGPGAGPILFEDVKCQGTESSLAQCQIKFFYSRSCDHQKGVGIICNISKNKK